MINLNEQQELAVNHLAGPCLVTSCPGSGKTRVLTERTIRLIQQGVIPKNILCITFTNKAANEMKKRICERIGSKDIGMFVGTFHSMCAMVIRAYYKRLGYTSQITILDQDGQKSLMKKCARALDFDIKEDNIDVEHIMYHINTSRELSEDNSEMEDRFKSKKDHWTIAEEYFKVLKKSNLIDFSGLLYEMIRLLEENQVVLEKLHNIFKYIQVDESQDCNKIQYDIINLLGNKYNNIFLVGDISQCVAADSLISVQVGESEECKNIKENSTIFSASGSGNYSLSKVERVYKKYCDNEVAMSIETDSGNKLVCSPDHIVFAGFSGENNTINKNYIVYLMEDDNSNFRIGVTKIYRNKKNGYIYGFKQRVHQQHASRIWFMGVFASFDEALIYEDIWSLQYSIPKNVFKTCHNKDVFQKHIDAVFSTINTKCNALKMLNDFGIMYSYPHHIPYSFGKNKGRNFTVTICSHSNSVFHTCAIYGDDMIDYQLLKDAGIAVRLKSNKRGWKFQKGSINLDFIYDILLQIKRVLGDINIIEKAKLVTGHSLPFCPVSNILEGMNVFVLLDNGQLSVDRVKKCKKIDYSGYMYDFDINRTHNFVANGIVSHNSIYRFRGARHENILDFLVKYPDCKRISLGKNYRSTPEIIEAADKLIRHNDSHIKNDFFTDNSNGDRVICNHFNSQYAEADWVKGKIKSYIDDLGWDYSDVAILYRLNKLSLDMQTSFAKDGIPYCVIGGPNYFNRKEIKDCISMLEFMVNRRNTVAFHRVLSTMNDVGDKTVAAIEAKAELDNVDLYDACESLVDSNSKRIQKASKKISNIYAKDFAGKHGGECLEELTSSFNYFQCLASFCKTDEEFEERKDNINELIIHATEFGKINPNVKDYLNNISLITDADKDAEKNAVTLMTVHASKGLEFPIVFIVGVEDDILPHYRALLEGDTEEEVSDAVEEERRICYVAMTRAMKYLSMTYCRYRKQRMKGGIVIDKKKCPSRFLLESGLIKKEEYEGHV